MSYKRKSVSKTLKIHSRQISEMASSFIIAEAASNHMCNMKLAKKMIDMASEAGADAIKFQTYKAERLVCKDLAGYWRYATGAKSQFEYYKNLDKFARDEYKQLFDYASKKRIIAFSTPFDVQSASMLNDLGVPLFKIASCDILDVRLLRHVAKFNKPVILSTGASTLKEIQKSINVILNTGNSKLILMVCTLSYPTDNQNAHLRRILTFKQRFPDMIIGLSDHTPPDANMLIPSVAVALGARVIEKHFTLNRNMSGSGHSFSVGQKDFKKMVDNIRLTETVLGSEEIRVYKIEEAARKNARRSLVANRNIKKGERIRDDLVGVKRPGTGLSPDLIDKVLGRVAKCDIKKDYQFNLKHLK